MDIGWDGYQWDAARAIGTANRALFKFDVASVVPSSADVLDARLGIYMYGEYTTAPASISAFRLTREWTGAATWRRSDGAVAWSIPGGDYDPYAVDTNPDVRGADRFHYWNLTGLVQQWAQLRAPNYGVLLRADTESGTTNTVKTMASGITDWAEIRPHLDIVHQPPRDDCTLDATEPRTAEWDPTIACSVIDGFGDEDGGATFAAQALESPPLRPLLEIVPAAIAIPPPSPLPVAAARYDTKADNEPVRADGIRPGMDGLDVVANPLFGQPGQARYLGVYHTKYGSAIDEFRVNIATSNNLVQWTRVRALDATRASHPTLRALPSGGWLLAYEKITSQYDNNTSNNSSLRLVHYSNTANLLGGIEQESRRLPRKLSKLFPGRDAGNEGTPDIRSVTWNGSLSNSRVRLGFHFKTRLDTDPVSYADREAIGTLTNGVWSVNPIRGLKLALIDLGFLGNHGQRRQFTYAGQRWQIYEAQRRRGSNTSWRLLLRRVGSRSLDVLDVRTARGSKSFANPATAAVLPDPEPTRAGQQVLTVGMFLFSEGAAPAEAGSLLFYQNVD